MWTTRLRWADSWLFSVVMAVALLGSCTRVDGESTSPRNDHVVVEVLGRVLRQPADQDQKIASITPITPVPTITTTSTEPPAPTTTTTTTVAPAEAEPVALAYRPRTSGFFHQLGNVGDVMTIRSGPGQEFPEIDSRPGGSLVLHGGAFATTATDETWINIADPASKVEVGWVYKELIGRRMKSIAVRTAEGTLPLRAHPGGWNSGVDIEVPQIVGLGCDAVQIEIRSAASHPQLSSHFVFGNKAPSAPLSDWEDPHWDLGNAEEPFFIPPGESVIVTVPARLPTTYYFLALDGENTAEAAFDYANEPVLNEDGDLTAAGTHQLTVQAACSTRPTPNT